VGYLKPNRMYKTLTLLAVFPALGHDVGDDFKPTLWTCWLKDGVSPLPLHLPWLSYRG
jgi:hypothetical protein